MIELVASLVSMIVLIVGVTTVFSTSKLDKEIDEEIKKKEEELKGK